MSDEKTFLYFECYRCGFHNKYPAVKDENAKAGEIVIKRCINCATFNEIVLPNSFRTVTKTVLRGMKHE
ncbi:MAG: hypothetical protein AAGI23_21465 [Bacteroidota bacterium]